jgi:multiple sugar transport system ATP-binding protein
VRQNLAFPLEMAHVGRRKVAERVAETARLLGIEAVLDAMPSTLSGGQRQRAAMGRALIRRPGLMLMDEPMSNLDAKMRTALRAELSAMQRRLQVTTVYVTHDQVEAMSLGDRVAVMRAGRVVQCSAPTEIYRSPVDSYVAQFMGSPPMNLLAATLVHDSLGLGLLIGRHRISIDDVAERWPGIDGLVGSDVIVGIRPEAFRSDPHGELELSVEYHEQVGAVRWVHALIDAPVIREIEATTGLVGIDELGEDESPSEAAVVVALEGRGDVNRWAPLRVAVDHDQLHLFDHDTRLAIETVLDDAGVSGEVRRLGQRSPARR